MAFDLASAKAIQGFDLSSAKDFDEPVYDDIPSPMSNVKAQPRQKTLLDRTAEMLSGGKFGSMQDLVYGGERPADSMLGQAGQIVRQSGIEGLQGIGQVGQVSPAMTAVGQNIPNMGKYTKPVTEALRKVPAAVLGKTSGVIDPNAINVAYQVGKSTSPELKAAISEGKDIPVVNRMVYNYARQHGLPHEWAATAIDPTRGKRPDLQGSWDIYDKLEREGTAAGKKLWEIFPKYEDFSKLNLPEQVKMAQQAGVDLGTYLPQKKLAEALAKGADAAAVAGALGHLPAALQGLVSLKLLPLMALQSPRVIGKAAQTAGATARVAGKAAPYAKAAIGELPLNQTAATLARLLSNQEEQ